MYYISKGDYLLQFNGVNSMEVWDLFKNYIVKLNLMYVKSSYLYIVSCSILCNTLIQHCFSVLICENTSSRIFAFKSKISP